MRYILATDVELYRHIYRVGLCQRRFFLPPPYAMLTVLGEFPPKICHFFISPWWEGYISLYYFHAVRFTFHRQVKMMRWFRRMLLRREYGRESFVSADDKATSATAACAMHCLIYQCHFTEKKVTDRDATMTERNLSAIRHRPILSCSKMARALLYCCWWQRVDRLWWVTITFIVASRDHRRVESNGDIASRERRACYIRQRCVISQRQL